MKNEAPPGVFDILPEDSRDPWKSSWRWHSLEGVLRTLAENYGFREIRTPILERRELFSESVGETSDIVSKEMYTFQDRGGRELCLRPEGTAACVRAFIEHHLDQAAKQHRFYYFAPMFRYERMQSGRYRQHHQFGVEIFGASSPMIDAELIALAFQMTTKLGMKGLKVQLNSLGNEESRARFKEALRDYLKAHFSRLSEESRVRLEKNPLRILDSKDPEDKAVIANGPKLDEFLDQESKEHGEKLLFLLQSLQIPVHFDPNLVRGLDYYQKTVFEITSEALGSQNALCGGGRYDGLIQKLGGPNLPSAGFGAGLERILQVMLKQELAFSPPKNPLLYIVPLGDLAEKKAFEIAYHLRMEGLFVVIDIDFGKKIGKALSKASSMKATFACVLGEDEVNLGQAEIKELFGNGRKSLSLAHFVPEFLTLIGKACEF